MSQEDVMDCLNELSDGESWVRVKDIQEVLRRNGKSEGIIKGVSDDLYALVTFGYVEWRGIGVWNHHKEFRPKRCR